MKAKLLGTSGVSVADQGRVMEIGSDESQTVAGSDSEEDILLETGADLPSEKKIIGPDNPTCSQFPSDTEFR